MTFLEGVGVLWCYRLKVGPFFLFSPMVHVSFFQAPRLDPEKVGVAPPFEFFILVRFVALVFDNYPTNTSIFSRGPS